MALARELRVRRSALLALEREGALDLILAYQRAYGRLTFRLDTLQARIAEAGEPKVSWLVRQAQYQLLLSEIEREVDGYAQRATQRIADQQSTALTLAEGDAHSLTVHALGKAPAPLVAQVQTSLAGLNPKAFERIVGNAADGKPLDRLLRAAAPTTVDLVKDALHYGVVSGQNPRVIAQEFRKAASFPLNRALTIARTETLRAYREGSLQTFKANRDVVGTWVWISDQGPNTCMSCAMQHGTEHPLSEDLESHPNCRCTMAPRTKSWDELGFKDIPDSRPTIQNGEDRFLALSPDEQLKRMGPSKFQAWQDGKIQLQDLVKQTRSPFGPGTREASLREALAG